MKAGKIIVGKNSSSFRIKAIHSDQYGFYVYKNDALLQGLIAKGYIYGCTKCSRDFYDYEDVAAHVLRAHGGRGRVYIKREG